MSSIQDNICRLQQAYPLFLNAFSTSSGDKAERQALTCEQKEASRLFSTTLRDTLQDNASPIQPALVYIQKRWSLTCHELLQTDEKCSDKFVKRITQLKSKLDGLQEPKSAEDIPCEKSDAECIADLLSGPSVQQALRSTYSHRVNYFFVQYPQAMQHVKIMVERIVQGVYGEQLKQNLFDAMKNPLMLDVNLKRMLFIDLHLRRVNPRDMCEWFKDCSEPDVETIRHYLWDLQVNLEATTSLSHAAIRALLLHKSLNLPSSVQTKLNNCLQKCDYSRERHNHVLKYLRPYFLPSKKQLQAIAQTQVTQNPERAIEIACRLSDDELKERLIKQAVENVSKNNPEHAWKMIQSLKSTDKSLYIRCLDPIFTQALQTESTQPAGDIICDLRTEPCYDQFAARYVEKLASKPLDELRSTLIITIIRSLKTFEQRASCLERCFLHQVRILDRGLESAVDSCQQLLERVKDDEAYPLALSSLFLISLCYGERFKDDSQLVKMNAEVTDKELRQSVFDRLVQYLKRTVSQGPRIDAILKSMEPYISDEQEKSYFLKVRVLMMHRYKPEEALKLAKTAPDVKTRIHLQKLCALSQPSGRNLIDEIHFDFDPRLDVRFSESLDSDLFRRAIYESGAAPTNLYTSEQLRQSQAVLAHILNLQL